MTTSFEERRAKRSPYTGRSLTNWLSAVARRSPALAFVLADQAGLVVASTLRGSQADEVAALAPLLANEATVDDGIRRRTTTVGLNVDRVDIEGVELLLCALGNDGQGCGSALSQAAPGVRRILSEYSAQAA